MDKYNEVHPRDRVWLNHTGEWSADATTWVTWKKPVLKDHGEDSMRGKCPDQANIKRRNTSKWLLRAAGGGRKAWRPGASWRDAEDVLRLHGADGYTTPNIVKTKQNKTKPWTEHFKIVNFMVCEFCLNKAVVLNL